MPKTLVDLDQLEALVAPACQSQGVELVDVRHQVEQGGPVLRVLIEVPGAEKLPKGVGGVTVDDCTRVSRAVSAVLDEHEDLIPGNYRLEVSSPGVERPLVKLRDFERYTGREARVTTTVIIDKRKNFTGTIARLQDANVVLAVENGAELAIPFSEIAKAHLVFRF